jgi:hypothetical protein
MESSSPPAPLRIPETPLEQPLFSNATLERGSRFAAAARCRTWQRALEVKVRARLSPHQAQDEQDQEDDKEDIEQDAGHIRAGGGQTSEAKERRDHMMSAHFSNDMGRILSQE